MQGMATETVESLPVEEHVVNAWATEESLLTAPLEEPAAPAISTMKSNERLFRHWHQRRALTLTALGFAGVALLALTAYARVTGSWLSWGGDGGGGGAAAAELWTGTRICTFSTGSSCSARSLLEMPAFHEVAVDGLMRVARTDGKPLLAPYDKASVRTLVSSCFLNISAELVKRYSYAAQDLDVVMFNKAERDAMLAYMRLLGDGRVQGLGRQVAQAIRSSSAAQGQRAGALAGAYSEAALRHNIGLTLYRDRNEIERLRKELVRGSLQRLWGEGRQWAMTLERENLRAMAATETLLPAGLSEMRAATIAGALEEARALLDIIRLSTYTNVPDAVTSLSGYLGDASAVVSCGAVAASSFSSQLVCPLKFGTQGIDALRAYYDILSAQTDSKELSLFGSNFPGISATET